MLKLNHQIKIVLLKFTVNEKRRFNPFLSFKDRYCIQCVSEKDTKSYYISNRMIVDLMTKTFIENDKSSRLTQRD